MLKLDAFVISVFIPTVAAKPWSAAVDARCGDCNSEWRS